MWWCLLALLMHSLFFNIWWTIFGWLHYLLHWWHFHLFKKHGKTWNNMFDLFCTSSDKLNSTLSSIKSKWNSLSILSLKMTFVLFFIRSKPLWWVTPIYVGDVQCFLGFPNFYWCFIAHYSMIVTLVIHLIQKYQTFVRRFEDKVYISTFESFFHNGPTFNSCNLSKPFILEMNTYDFAWGVVFSQFGKDNLFHLVVSILIIFFLLR
jgi:hypothetical protein